MNDQRLIPGTEATPIRAATQTETQSSDQHTPRLRRPRRARGVLEPICLDERLPADHAARAIWRIVE